MAFQIIWSETASEDLREIVRYIALDDSIAAAHLADRIVSRIELAGNLPLSNPSSTVRGLDHAFS